MQSVSSRIWTRVTVSISYDDNHYTTYTSLNDKPYPTDVKGVQLLEGLGNYLAKFLSHISNSNLMAPIRNLMTSDVPWRRSEIPEEASGRIMKIVSKASELRYYDHSKPLVIQCDVSEKGLGAAQLQEGQPLAYVSRTCTDTETRYAQIEKEVLAVVYACKQFHQYTLVNTFSADRTLTIGCNNEKRLGKMPEAPAKHVNEATRI